MLSQGSGHGIDEQYARTKELEMSSSPVHAETVNTQSGELPFHLPGSCGGAGLR
jgi:hypothetical protein